MSLSKQIVSDRQWLDKHITLHYLRVESWLTAFSEEVKLVVEWHHSLLTVSPHLHCLLAAFLGVLLTLLRGSNRHVELSDLVSILAGSWNFDWACPVEAEVAKCKRQLLDVDLRKSGVVLGNKEVSWQNTTLRCWGWSQEEIKLLAFSSLVLN